MTRVSTRERGGRSTLVGRADFERALADFVNRTLVKPGDAPPVHAETLLFEDGILNSLRILDLIAFVERTLALRIPDKAIRLKNFRSIRAIADAFVADASDRDGEPAAEAADGAA